jgi:hypothetical protein
MKVKKVKINKEYRSRSEIPEILLDISKLLCLLEKDQLSDAYVLPIQDLNFKIKSLLPFDNESFTICLFCEENQQKTEILSTFTIKEGEALVCLPLKSKFNLLSSLNMELKHCFEFQIQNSILHSTSFHIQTQHLKNCSELPDWLETKFRGFKFHREIPMSDGLHASVGSFGKFFFECPTGDDSDWSVYVFDQKCRVWHSGKNLKRQEIYLGSHVVLFEVMSIVLPAKVDVYHKNNFWRSFSVNCV